MKFQYFNKKTIFLGTVSFVLYMILIPSKQQSMDNYYLRELQDFYWLRDYTRCNMTDYATWHKGAKKPNKK